MTNEREPGDSHSKCKCLVPIKINKLEMFGPAKSIIDLFISRSPRNTILREPPVIGCWSPRAGRRRSFFVYSDGKGLGAEDVQLEPVFSGMNDWWGSVGHGGAPAIGDVCFLVTWMNSG